IIKRNAANTAWICSDDANSGGTVTTVNTGTGLTGGPITTSGTISLASNYVDGSVYDSRFVNESQANSITSAMITDGTIVNSDLSAGTYSNITGVGTLGSLTVSGNTYLATTSGNVGIGTNSPSTKLHLYTTSSSGGSIALRMQYAFTGPINGDRSSDWTLYATTGSGSFGISNSAGTHFYIEGNNNYIGIGTTGPTQKLDVSGNIRASGQLISAVPTGTAPLSVSSTTQVNNLNADMVDGWHAAVVLTGSPVYLYGTNDINWVELYRWAVDFDSIPGNTLRGLGFVQSSAGSIAGRIRFLVNGAQVGSDCTFTATTTNTALNCPVITYTKPSGVGQIRIEIRRDATGSENIYYGQNTLTLK
ncbi:MAG: hypothetical protein N3B13_05290, partial [Deltaproteobacteria bacterium]|nr:hypothetical protein [Deltaproteobacteria bacterium]